MKTVQTAENRVQQVAHEAELARANQREQKRRGVVVGQSRALPVVELLLLLTASFVVLIFGR